MANVRGLKIPARNKKNVRTERKKSRKKTRPQSTPLNPPGPSRQVQFYQLLVAARKEWLMDALSEALGKADPNIVKEQIIKYVPVEAQKVLAASGVRDEHVFPLPVVIETKPSLVGYFRLLLGIPQKSFYKGKTGMGAVRSMEETGLASPKQQRRISEFCEAMARPLAELVKQVPNITSKDIAELPLLTYGAQLQGSNNTAIGKKAMQDVFIAVSEVMGDHIVKQEPDKLTVRNAAGRSVSISLAHDPDFGD